MSISVFILGIIAIAVGILVVWAVIESLDTFLKAESLLSKIVELILGGILLILGAGLCALGIILAESEIPRAHLMTILKTAVFAAEVCALYLFYWWAVECSPVEAGILTGTAVVGSFFVK